MDGRWHLIALHQITGVGWHTIAHMIESGWVPGEGVSSSTYQYLKQSSIPTKVINRIKEKFKVSFVKQVVDEFKERKITAITRFDPTYPPYLKEIAQPPWVLYLRGNAELLKTPCLAVVGTRKPTSYGRQMTRKFAQDLANQGLTIVSGMAYGVDAEAHRSVLDIEGKTIAVFASGVDVVYPKRHRKLYDQIVEMGVVISESAPGTKPHPGLFPLRNRVISGLSLGTLVIEAAQKSGSLITANYSVEQGREVFAVPGPIHASMSEGTLQLIQEGAKCVRKVEDVLEELPSIQPILQSRSKPIQHQKKEKVLSTEERILLAYIANEPIQITFLLEKLSKKLSVGQIHQTLLSLELKQEITQLPGQHYIRRLA